MDNIMFFIFVLCILFLVYSIWNTAKEPKLLGAKPDLISVCIVNTIIFVMNLFSGNKKAYVSLNELTQRYEVLKLQNN